jgi:hypothetical protein
MNDHPEPVAMRFDIEQPERHPQITADGIFILPMTLKIAGSIVPQHSHKYDHTSYIAAGAVKAWKDGAYIGEFKAPTGILIEAGTMHRFLTLEPNTTILCIHNFTHPDAVAVLAENGYTAAELLEKD